MRSKRRFLVLLTGAFGPTGGIEAYCRLLVRAFQELAIESAGECEVQLLLDEAHQLDARYLDARLAPPRCFAGSRPRFAMAALEQVVRLRPSLIVLGHVNFLSLGLASRALRPSAAQLCTVYGAEVWRSLPLVKRVGLRTMSRTLSISEYTRAQLIEHSGVDRKRVGLLPCALDPFWAESFSKLATGADPDAPPTILSVGRLAADEAKKGFDQVIRALPEIAKTVRGCRYVIIGDGADRPRLEALARDRGVAGQVEFRGRVSAEELARAYAECAVFALPSAQEGFGIVFLEAALFDKPSIGGDHGGIPEVILDGETGRLVQHGDVAGLARVATDLLTDRPALQAMGRRAKARLHERFEYPSLLRTLRAEVERILDGH